MTRKIDPEELRLGIEHEMEHTDDPEFARQIAMDHLRKHGDYYSKLEACEKTMQSNGRWSKRYIDSLPDSAFLYVDTSCRKHVDPDGRSHPLSCRHFPYRDEDGVIDLPHLRNAISRAPQSNLPRSVVRRVQEQGRALLERKDRREPGRTIIGGRPPREVYGPPPRRKPVKRAKVYTQEEIAAGAYRRNGDVVELFSGSRKRPVTELQSKLGGLIHEIVSASTEADMACPSDPDAEMLCDEAIHAAYLAVDALDYAKDQGLLSRALTGVRIAHRGFTEVLSDAEHLRMPLPVRVALMRDLKKVEASVLKAESFLAGLTEEEE